MSGGATVDGDERLRLFLALELPPDVDPVRSTLQLSLGSSPLAFIRGAGQRLRAYPYACTEQLASSAEPLLALYRSAPLLGADTDGLSGGSLLEAVR